MYSNKGAGPIRDKIRKFFINLKKISSHVPQAGNVLMFGMDHPRRKEIQFCSNKVFRVMYGPTSGIHIWAQ